MRFSKLRHTALGFSLETWLRKTDHIAPASLPHWRWEVPRSGGRSEIDVLLKAYTDRPPTQAATSKGHPDMESIKRQMGVGVQQQLLAGRDAEALRQLHRLASVDLFDGDAFRLFLALTVHLNSATLAAARRALRDRVVMHLSCRPRIERAFQSRASFAPCEENGVAQIVVVGDPHIHLFDFDASSGVLTVPAPDTYEHLPLKTMSAMFFFALLGNVQGLLKVDDDHRMKDKHALLWGFSRLQTARALQVGTLSRTPVLGWHPRAWHFGKSTDPVIDSKVFTLPGTTRWANGASGYYVNHAAIRLLLWSYVYFPEYIAIGMYEDIVISDLIERQGGHLGHIDMRRALSDTADY